MSDIEKIDSLKTYVHIPADEWSRMQAYITELKRANAALNAQIEEYNKEFVKPEGRDNGFGLFLQRMVGKW